MSNVLIGIIGVILFIGLALAGALILGDDFKTATASSQAAAAAQTMLQIQSAIGMWKVKTGQSSLPNGNTAFLAPRFLKTDAPNPTKVGRAAGPNYQYQPKSNNDLCPDPNDEGALPNAAYIHFPVGYGIEDSKVCQAIADIYTGGVIGNDVRPVTAMGCNLIDAQPQCGMPGQWYMIYAKIN
jgi:hypothetical protein